MANCPSCRVALNTSQPVRGARSLLCSGCRTVIAWVDGELQEKVDRQRPSWWACWSLLVAMGFCVLIVLGFLLSSRVGFRGLAGGLLNLFFLLLFGMLAVPLGIRALDDIDVPHKRRWGTWLAQAGILTGFLTAVLTVVLVVWSSTNYFSFRLRTDNGYLNISPKRAPNYVPLVPPSIFGEMPTVRDNQAYEVVLDWQTAVWKWMFPAAEVDPETHYKDFHTTFANPDFDDSDWRTSQFTDGTGIGYGRVGDANYGVVLQTPDYGKRYTAYFRTQFTTQQAMRSLALEMCCDDGAIIYIDGREVARHNMPPGPEAYRLMAAQAVSRDDELVVVTVPFEIGELAPGEHILAISLHNNSNTSSDLGMRQIVLYGSHEAEPE